MDRKIRTAFIYKKTWHRLTGKHWNDVLYNFFMNAVKRNSRIDIKYFPVEREFDVTKLSGFDVILLPDNFNNGSPDRLVGIEKCSIPVICKAGDSHSAQWENRFDYHEKYKIDCYFNDDVPSHFYKFYPKEYEYRHMWFRFEPGKFTSISNFESRIRDRILVTGVTGKQNRILRLGLQILKPKRNDYIHYKLRTKCRMLPYADYKFDPDYAKLLSQYRASVAATTLSPTAKYLEVPAAGCLAFMEITKENEGRLLGFKDGENAIFIDEKNYKRKFQEYLADVDNPKWAKIAAAGREYVMNNLTNDRAVDQLADLMEEYVK